METVRYHLLAQLNASDTLDSIGGTYKTMKTAKDAAKKEAQIGENGDWAPGSRFVIVEQKGNIYEFVDVGIIPNAGLVWQK